MTFPAAISFKCFVTLISPGWSRQNTAACCGRILLNQLQAWWSAKTCNKTVSLCLILPRGTETPKGILLTWVSVQLQDRSWISVQKINKYIYIYCQLTPVVQKYFWFYWSLKAHSHFCLCWLYHMLKVTPSLWNVLRRHLKSRFKAHSCWYYQAEQLGLTVMHLV